MLALVKGLGQRPECNALFDDEAGVVTRHEAVHLGIATQTDRGLYVPVVKHVEAMDVWTAAAEMELHKTRDEKQVLMNYRFDIHHHKSWPNGWLEQHRSSKPEVGILVFTMPKIVLSLSMAELKFVES